MDHVLVTGAGGFIGHHLVTFLKDRGYWVRGVDIRLPDYTDVDADEFEIVDLRRYDDAVHAMRGIDQVYALSGDMGGMGFISANHATILSNNALTNLHTIEAPISAASADICTARPPAAIPSACRAARMLCRFARKTRTPASAQDAYGSEKLLSERLCLSYAGEHDMDTRII